MEEQWELRQAFRKCQLQVLPQRVPFSACACGWADMNHAGLLWAEALAHAGSTLEAKGSVMLLDLPGLWAGSGLCLLGVCLVLCR